MAANSQRMSYRVGAKGQAQVLLILLYQEKGNLLVDKAGNLAQSAMESVQQAGQTMTAKAQGAVNAVRDATGWNKN